MDPFGRVCHGLRPPERSTESLILRCARAYARDILELKAAWARDDSYITDYIDEVHGSARMVGEREDAWIRSYYCDNGWMENPHGPAY